MAFCVFIHRPDSRYDDDPSRHYQFPKQYLNRAKQAIGDWIVYYEPRKVADTNGYYAIARVSEIIQDPQEPDMYRALIEPRSYMALGKSVPFRAKGQVVERGVLNASGAISGRAQAAVREISPADFDRILELGLSDTLENVDDLPDLPITTVVPPGFQDVSAPFRSEHIRERLPYLASRTVRDRNFRHVVLEAYQERCALTGLRLINGGGAAEVQAAHIKPVEANGPDMISNGLALSGTVLWIFDRGLVSLEDNLEIMVSRQVNDINAVRSMLNADGRLLRPKRPADCPHPVFLKWHRACRFKH